MECKDWRQLWHTVILSDVSHKLSGSNNILVIGRNLGSQQHSNKTESRIGELGKCDLSHQDIERRVREIVFGELLSCRCARPVLWERGAAPHGVHLQILSSLKYVALRINSLIWTAFFLTLACFCCLIAVNLWSFHLPWKNQSHPINYILVQVGITPRVLVSWQLLFNQVNCLLRWKFIFNEVYFGISQILFLHLVKTKILPAPFPLKEWGMTFSSPGPFASMIPASMIPTVIYMRVITVPVIHRKEVWVLLPIVIWNHTKLRSY